MHMLLVFGSNNTLLAKRAVYACKEDTQMHLLPTAWHAT
jgi:hypothetical protein